MKLKNILKVTNNVLFFLSNLSFVSLKLLNSLIILLCVVKLSVLTLKLSFTAFKLITSVKKEINDLQE